MARWTRQDGRRLLVLENEFCRISVWPGMGGAIASYIDRESGIDVIWRNPYGWPPRARALDQPMRGGSDLYDVMDGSWFVSLPTGFFSCDYFGAPIGIHGELRSLPWEVESIRSDVLEVRVVLVGRSVRTPFIYRRELTLRGDSALMHWQETVENRASVAMPIMWLQHPTFGGPLIDGAQLIVPAKTVGVFKSETAEAQQLENGYRGRWPFVPERKGGRMRDCSMVSAQGSGMDHSIQLTDFEAGWGCIWNEQRRFGFAMEWDLKLFPYAWSWNSGNAVAHYPVWGDAHVMTLQPSTSPIGRFADLVKTGELLQVPARGSVTAGMSTGFVRSKQGPWS